MALISNGQGLFLGQFMQANALAKMDFIGVLQELSDPPTKKRKKIVSANGANSTLLEVNLPANALLDSYVIKVTAMRSNFAKATLAGEVRESNNSPMQVIVDFGYMVTVNALRIRYDMSGFKAYSWLGSKFDLQNNAAPTIKPREASPGETEDLIKYQFAQEIRTERLLLEFDDSISFSLIKDSLELSLPDLPSDLALSINNEVPVWQFAGMVQPGAETQVNQQTWNSEGELLVPIAEFVQPFLGDATNSHLADITIELSSKTPGKLGLEIQQKSLRLLHRTLFSGDTELQADFAMEGQLKVNLQAPPKGKKLREILGVQMTLAGAFSPTRALPPVGSPANQISELILGNGKAAIVRLDGFAQLSHISGIRLPLSTPSSRAEARVALWRGDEFGPVEVISEAISDPISWDGDQEQWLQFDLVEPYENTLDEIYWMALLVERGEVDWGLASADDLENYPLKLGAPAGPWRALPAIFSGPTGLGPVAGRVHVLGLAEDTPLAPLQLRLGADSEIEDVHLTDQSMRVQLDLQTAAANTGKAELTLISRAVGQLTLSEVDVITEE